MGSAMICSRSASCAEVFSEATAATTTTTKWQYDITRRLAILNMVIICCSLYQCVVVEYEYILVVNILSSDLKINLCSTSSSSTTWIIYIFEMKK